MGSFAFVLSLTVVLFCAFIVNLAARPKTASRLTCTALVITGVGGLLCYSYGYSAVLDNIPLGVIRATLSSVGMFLGRNDISSVSEAPFFQTQLGLTLLWVLHLIALYTTASAAIITIGASILRRIRLVLARRGDLVLIYGSHEGALAFGRQMMDRRNSSVVFVDESPVVGSEDAIRGMGSLLRQDSAALHPDHRFLRSLGIRSGGRQVTLYALSKTGSDNMRYASDFLKALETDGILSRQTRLVLLGREDGWESAFSTDKGYGYGSVTMMDEAEMAGRLLVRRLPPLPGTLLQRRRSGPGRLPLSRCRFWPRGAGRTAQPHHQCPICRQHLPCRRLCSGLRRCFRLSLPAESSAAAAVRHIFFQL